MNFSHSLQIYTLYKKFYKIYLVYGTKKSHTLALSAVAQQFGLTPKQVQTIVNNIRAYLKKQQ